jgi:class 3 adenylate cyclase
MSWSCGRTNPADAVGTVSLVTPGLPGAVISLLGTGDHATLERMLELLRPARRPGAVMFVDLEGSAQLARRLSTQAFFTLIRRLIFRIDEEVVSQEGGGQARGRWRQRSDRHRRSRAHHRLRRVG